MSAAFFETLSYAQAPCAMAPLPGSLPEGEGELVKRG